MPPLDGSALVFTSDENNPMPTLNGTVSRTDESQPCSAMNNGHRSWNSLAELVRALFPFPAISNTSLTTPYGCRLERRDCVYKVTNSLSRLDTRTRRSQYTIFSPAAAHFAALVYIEKYGYSGEYTRTGSRASFYYKGVPVRIDEFPDSPANCRYSVCMSSSQPWRWFRSFPALIHYIDRQRTKIEEKAGPFELKNHVDWKKAKNICPLGNSRRALAVYDLVYLTPTSTKRKHLKARGIAEVEKEYHRLLKKPDCISVSVWKATPSGVWKEVFIPERRA